jgi:uncharacterized protein YjbI with pentapeptide repeats
MRFNPKEALATIANCCLTSLCVEQGLSSEQSTMLGNVAEGVVKGFELKGNSESSTSERLKNIILEAISKTRKSHIDFGDLSEDFDNYILSEAFSAKSFREYIISDCPVWLLENKIDSILKMSEIYDPTTIDLGSFCIALISIINELIENDHELLTLVTYYIIRDIHGSIDNRNGQAFSNNKFDDFVNRWDRFLFLHSDRSNQTIKLRDIYIPPLCKINHQSTILDSTKQISNFILSKDFHFMVITGNPGIGKSSFLCYLAANLLRTKAAIFLRMADLDTSVAKISLLDAILDFLECKKRDLQGKILVLDGYDELRVDGLHYNLCGDLVGESAAIPMLKIIISTRKNYIDINHITYDTDFKNCITLDLQPFSKALMIKYIRKYNSLAKIDQQVSTKTFEISKTPTEVFGIPFILYLVCSFGIAIEGITTTIDVYSHVFDKNNGIFDRIYYDNKHYLLSNSIIKPRIIKISQLFAYKMFNGNTLELLNNDVTCILENFPDCKDYYAIGNYFDIGTKVSFVHKTIYEYFLCLFIIDGLFEIITRKSSPKQVYDYLFATYFCDNYITSGIEDMLPIIIEKRKNTDNDLDKDIIKASIPYVLKNLLNKNSDSDVLIDYKRMQNLISSACKIYKIILGDKWMYNIGEDVSDYFVLLFKLKNYVRIELCGVSLYAKDLSSIILRAPIRESCFERCNLCRVDIFRTYIEDCEFVNCDLEGIHAAGVHFIKCRFTGVSFANSNLQRASFIDCTLINVNFTMCDLSNIKFRGCKITCDLNYALLKDADIMLTDFEYKGFVPDENINGACFDVVSVNGWVKHKNISDLSNVGICLSSYKNSDRAGIYHSSQRDDYFRLSEYSNLFKNYEQLHSLITEHRSIKVQLCLYSGKYDFDPNFFFDGMFADIIGISLIESSLKVLLSFKNCIKENSKQVSRANKNLYSGLKKTWASMQNQKISILERKIEIPFSDNEVKINLFRPLSRIICGHHQKPHVISKSMPINRIGRSEKCYSEVFWWRPYVD